MPNQDIIEFLKPENFSCAWEIAWAMEEAKNQLLQLFWRGVARALKTRIAELNLADVFHIDGKDRREKNPRTAGDGVFLVRRGISPDRQHLQIGVFYENQKLYAGMTCSKADPDPGSLPEVQAVCRVLPGHWKKDRGIWVGYENPSHNLYDPAFWMKLVQGSDEVAKSTIEQLMDVLRERDLLSSADKALQAVPLASNGLTAHGEPAL